MHEQPREKIKLIIPEKIIEDSNKINEFFNLPFVHATPSFGSHKKIYDSYKWIIDNNESYKFNIFEGRTLNVGLQSTPVIIKNTNTRQEFIDPLNNLVIDLRKDGIEAYGISPEALDNEDWKSIGLYNGLSQNIPFEDNFFGTILCISFLDESYSDLYGIEKEEPDFFKKTAEEFKRVLSPEGRAIITGCSVPIKAVNAFSNEGFRVDNIAKDENSVIYLSNCY